RPRKSTASIHAGGACVCKTTRNREAGPVRGPFTATRDPHGAARRMVRRAVPRSRIVSSSQSTRGKTMTKTMNAGTIVTLCAALVCGLVLAAPGRSAAAGQAMPAERAASEGLTLVESPVMAQAWLKPGVDLRRYDTLLVLPTTVSAWQSRGYGSDYPVSEQQL